MRPISYLSLILAPAVAFFIYMYFFKRSEKPYRSLLFWSFIAGIPGIVVPVIAEYISFRLGLNDLRNLKRTLFFGFVTVGFSSELGKFLLYRYLIMPATAITRPIHAVTMSVMTALGFSTAALLLFFIDPLSVRHLFPPTLYAFIFVPANLIFAVTLGFFMGMSKMTRSYFILPVTGLFAATFFHGLFNFCLLANDFRLLSMFAFGSMLIVFFLGIKAFTTNPETLQ